MEITTHTNTNCPLGNQSAIIEQMSWEKVKTLWRSATFLSANGATDLVTDLNTDDSGRGIIQALKTQARLKELFEQSARVWEGYSIEEHTGMVIGQAERYRLFSALPYGFNPREFRVMLALHDIGKSVPEDPKQQHQATLEIIESHSVQLKIKRESLLQFVSIIGADKVGALFKAATAYRPTKPEFTAWAVRSEKGELSLDEIKDFVALSKFKLGSDEKIDQAVDDLVNFVKIEALKVGMKPREYFQLLMTYYQADTLAYTHDAKNFEGKRGRPSLEHLYVLNEGYDHNASDSQMFVKDPGTRLLIFATPLQEIIEGRVKALIE